jgi:hypothetical protein
MNRGELLRQRRCRFLLLAMLFGILLVAFQPSWVTLGVALAGESVLGVTWWRSCRRSPGTAPSGPGPGARSGRPRDA